MSVSLEELLKALEEAPSNKRKKRVAGEHRLPAHVFRFAEEMKIEEGIKLCFEIFREVLENKFDISRFNVSYVKTDEAKLKKLKTEDLKKY